MGHGGFKVQVQQTFQPVLAQSCRIDAMEKTKNKERFPLSHGTVAAISMNLMKNLLHLEFERAHPYRVGVSGGIDWQVLTHPALTCRATGCAVPAGLDSLRRSPSPKKSDEYKVEASTRHSFRNTRAQLFLLASLRRDPS
jgi:hypothetical protein